MDIVEEKSVVQKVTIGYKCDVCGKESSGLNDGQFYNFSSHHSDWGSDSEDSFETHDVCSVKCYAEKLKYLVNESDSNTLEADGKDLPFLKQLVEELTIKKEGE